MSATSEHPTSRLGFEVLRGAVTVFVDGEPTSVGGPQQRRLLSALLAEHDTVMSADRLVELIWPPDDAPSAARRTVMTYVSRLRSILGPDVIVTGDQGYELVLDGCRFDADDFENELALARNDASDEALVRYERAVGMFTGRAFGDEGAESWLRPVAARLDELRLVAIEEWCELLIEQGRAADAVVICEPLVAQHPLREPFVGLLMRALYVAGRQAESLRIFQAHRDYLIDETGLEPSAALVDLDRRIAAGQLDILTAEPAVPGYELEELIGEGAFGAVYRAVQPSVGRDVAVKVVRPELADDPRFVQRFEAEAQLVARLEHPHVVPLYDFWRRPGGAFLVFRLLRGGSLTDRFEQGPMVLGDVSRLLGEVGAALSAAHALGIVHRDVKPSNILFDESGNAYLADFGIAVAGPEHGPGRAGARDDGLELGSAGSPLYASPEQVRDASATAASDQYALAAVVWEALAGSPPFPGVTIEEVMRAKLTGPVAALPPAIDLPTEAGAVLTRATAVDPADRFPTIDDFVAEWERSTRAVDPLHRTGRLDTVVRSGADSPTTASLHTLAANPYKGLRAFREADAADFHGRDALVGQLVGRLDESSWVTVVGPSGSGKSSIVHAGAVPEFRRRGGLVVTMVPGADPIEELRTALERVATASDTDIDAELRRADGLATLTSELVDDDQELLLVVDQFEELWVQADASARDHFATLLVTAVSSEPRLKVVATLRADMYDRPLQHATLGPTVSDSSLAVTPLSAAELEEAITAPAAACGVRFEPGLVATMVQDVAERPGALPLLQFALTEMWERRSGGTIPATAYDAVGGVGGALARRAEELYQSLDQAQHDDVRRLFLQLVAPGNETDDLRRRATLDELRTVERQVIDIYASNRLLVTDHHPATREPTVEVAHEALLREWPRLAEWIDAERDSLRFRRALAVAAAEWRAQDEDPSALLRGTRLLAAEEVTRSFPGSSSEMRYIEASRAVADREAAETAARLARQARQNRRLRRLVAGVAAALILAVAAGAIAIDQRGRAEEETARAEQEAGRAEEETARAEEEAGRAAATAEQATVARIAADSQRLASTRRDLAMLLAVEAANRSDEPATARALASAVFQDPDFVRYHHADVRPRTAIPGPGLPDEPAFSPDSQRLAIPDSSVGRIRIVDAQTGDVLSEVDYPATARPLEVRQLIWPDDDALTIVATSSMITIDPSTGEATTPEVTLEPAVHQIELSPDGTRLAVVLHDAGTEAIVEVRSLPAGELEMRRQMPCCASDHELSTQITLPGTLAWLDQRLFVVSGSGAIEEWDAESGTTVATVGSGFPAAWGLHFTSDGSLALITGVTGGGSSPTEVFQAYDVESWTPQWDDPPPYVGSVVDDPDGSAVIVADAFGGGAVVSVDRDTGESETGTIDLHSWRGCEVQDSPDGRLLLVFSCDSYDFGLWALDGSGAAIRRLAGDAPFAGIRSGAVSQDGTWAILNDAGFTARVLEVETGRTAPLAYPDAWAIFDAQDRVLLVDSELRTGRSVGPVADPREDFDTEFGTDPLDGLPLRTDSHPETNLDATVFGASSIVVSGTAAPRRYLNYPYGDVLSIAFDRTGERLFIAGVGGLVVFDLTGESPEEVPIPFEAYALAVDADREVFVISEPTGTLSLRDPDTGERLGRDIPSNVTYPTLQLSPDGALLFSLDGDAHLRVYDIEARSLLAGPIDLDGSAGGVSPGPQSSWILTARRDSVVAIDLDRASLLAAACAAVGRNLTIDEWDAFVGGPPASTCPQWPPPE